MSPFHSAFSVKEKASDIVSECIASLGKTAHPQDTLGFLYTTDVLSPELDAVLSGLKEATNVRHWVGSLGAGVMTQGKEIYDRPASSVMLAQLDQGAFRLIPPLTHDIADFVREQRDWLISGNQHFGVLHGDPANPATPQLIQSLAAEVSGGFFVGGLTSSSGANLQISEGITFGGISGVIFKDDVAIATGHTQGCTPIASKHQITRCKRNVLVELDERPALDVFREDIGELLAKDLNRAAGYIFVGLPIAGSDTGDYLVRNLLAIDQTRKLIAVGDILAEGQDLQFCRRDGNSAREDMERMLQVLKRRLSGNPRGALYYSCLGRGRHQFGDNSEELNLISEELGEIPLVGFFANGEIFNNRLYGYTGVLSIFL